MSEAGQIDPWPQVASVMAGVGAQVRTKRGTLGMTLEELSQASGVSTGLLSQVERGKGNPSFNALVRIAHAIGTPIAQLLHQEREISPVVRRGDRRRLDLHAAGGVETVHELLTPGLDQMLEVVQVEAPPGYTTEGTPFTHAGEEFGLILAGVHEVHLGDVCYVLEAGDSITYPSTVPHWYRNAGTEPVTALWVITPPTF